MFLLPKKIDSLFTEWGRHHKRLPPHNQDIKNKIFSAFGSGATPAARRLARRPWFMFAGAAFAVVVIAITHSTYFPTREHYGIKPPTPPEAKDYAVDSSVQRAGPPTVTLDDLGIEYGQSTGLGSQDIRNTPLGRIAVGIGSVLNRISNTLPPNTPPPVTDDREFLKTDYYAYIYTRQVSKLARQIQTMVRGHGGRVDYTSIQKEYANFNFVIPKDSFNQFQAELAELVPARFISENIQSTNLLPEKQTIEHETTAAQTTLATLQKKRQTIVATHSASVKTINARLAALAAAVATIDKKLAEPESEPGQPAALEEQKVTLLNERASLRGRLAREKATYKNTLADSDTHIASEEARLDDAQKQDTQLLDTVETVKGSVSIDWISVFGIINLYLGNWIWPLLLGVALSLYYYRRRPKLELPY